MIVGIGTDLLRIERMRRILADDRGSDPFLRKAFTPEERAEGARRPDPATYFATRFAAKEAVFKALGAPGDAVELTDIAIANEETGRPTATLRGTAERFARARGATAVHLSLSYENDHALAFAVLEADGTDRTGQGKQEETR